MSWSIINVPNMLSWARVGATPLTVWMIAHGDMRGAFIVFVAAGITDALDGFIARQFNLVTNFGRIIDPIADKSLLVATYLTLAFTHHLPWWLVGLVVGRDVLIVTAWGISRLFGFRIEPAPVLISKINTGLQIALAATVLLASGFGLARLDDLITILIWLTAATTIASWAQYFVLWILTHGTMQKKPGA